MFFPGGRVNVGQMGGEAGIMSRGIVAREALVKQIGRISFTLFLLLVTMFGCGAPETTTQPESANSRDPHSFSRPDEVVVRHLSLDLDVDFAGVNTCQRGRLRCPVASAGPVEWRRESPISAEVQMGW